MSEYLDRLAERVEAEINRKGLTREEAAYKSNLAIKTIDRILDKREHIPRAHTRRSLSDGLDIPIEELAPPWETKPDQLDRIEAMLRQLLDHFDISELEAIADDADRDAARAPARKGRQRG